MLLGRDTDEWVPIPTIGNRIHSKYQVRWCQEGIHSNYLNPARDSRRPEPDHCAVAKELLRLGFIEELPVEEREVQRIKKGQVRCAALTVNGTQCANTCSAATGLCSVHIRQKEFRCQSP
jgi:hypothetical protein